MRTFGQHFQSKHGIRWQMLGGACAKPLTAAFATHFRIAGLNLQQWSRQAAQMPASKRNGSNLKTGRKAKWWVACHTWQHTTFGVHCSTQCTKGINSSVTTFCSKISSVVDIVKDLEQMAEKQHQRTETELIKGQLQHIIGGSGTIHPSIQKLRSTLSPFGATTPRIIYSNMNKRN